MAPRLIDITGQQFGHLVAVKYIGGSIWRCRCERCGGRRLARSYELRSGTAYQCLECNQIDLKEARARDAATRATMREKS